MADSTKHLGACNLELGGGQASPELMMDLIEVTVDQSSQVPDVFTIRIHDAKFKWVDDGSIKEGSKVKIKMADGEKQLTDITSGEITSVEMDMTAHGTPTLILRGYDLSHKLHRGRQSKTYLQMTDADIVKKVAGEAGLSAECDSTSEVYPHIFQNNQTNWEFLLERANRIGFDLSVKEDKLIFKKSTQSREGNVEVEWGKTLRSFRVNRNNMQEVKQVVVRGWDPKQKKSIVGTAETPEIQPEVKAKSAKGQGQAVLTITNKPVYTQEEAKKLAQSVLEDIASNYIEAEGLTYGEPKIKPRSKVQIGNIGDRFKGSYMVTSATHTWSPQEGYTTSFVTSGRQQHSLLNALGVSQSKRGRTMQSNPGVCIGIVTNNDDPDKMGRVKVKIPTLTEDHETFWCRIASLMAGKNRGWYILPEVDDEVLVVFEHGDIHRPYIIGMLWNGKDTLPEKDVLGSGSVVDKRVFYSRIGHKIVFNDKDGKGEILTNTKNGHKILMDDANENVQVITKDKHEMLMDDKNKKVHVKTAGGLTFEMDEKSQTKITVKDTSGNSVVIQPTKIAITGAMKIEIKAPNISVEADAMLDLKGSATVNVQGGIVKIN